jgi:hypothetical protein
VDLQTALQAISEARGDFQAAATSIIEKKRAEVEAMNEENLRAGIEASLKQSVRIFFHTFFLKKLFLSLFLKGSLGKTDNEEVDDGTACNICCNSMKPESDTPEVKFSCGHTCCIKCAKRLLSSTETCHICRKRVYTYTNVQ